MAQVWIRVKISFVGLDNVKEHGAEKRLTPHQKKKRIQLTLPSLHVV